jgi:hypothetical protein
MPGLSAHKKMLNDLEIMLARLQYLRASTVQPATHYISAWKVSSSGKNFSAVSQKTMKLFFYLLNLFCVPLLRLLSSPSLVHGGKNVYTKLYEILIFLSSFFLVVVVAFC